MLMRNPGPAAWRRGRKQGTGQLLAQHRQQKLLTGVENARQGQGAEVQQ